MFRERRHLSGASPSPSRASATGSSFSQQHADLPVELSEVVSDSGDLHHHHAMMHLDDDEDDENLGEEKDSDESNDEDNEEEDMLEGSRIADSKAEGSMDDDNNDLDEGAEQDEMNENSDEPRGVSFVDRGSTSRVSMGASGVFASAIGKISVLLKQHRPNSTKLRSFARHIAKNKKVQELSNIRCTQRLAPHAGPIWVMEWSPAPSAYLATSGKDGKLVVWEVDTDILPGDSPIHRGTTTGEGSSESSPRLSTVSTGVTAQNPVSSDLGGEGTTSGKHSSMSGRHGFINRNSSSGNYTQIGAGSSPQKSGDPSASEQAQETVGGVIVSGTPLLKKRPYRVFIGHTADITSISWSKSSFLATGSVDKTCRVWNIAADSCLAVLKHPDFVSGVDFHPLDDSLLVTGCFDKKLRFWDIPTGIVQQRIKCASYVTACKFNHTGEMAAAGLYVGHVVFYQMAPFGYGKPVTSEMRFYTQIETRNKTGAEKKGRKVTSIRFVNVTERNGPVSRVQEYMLVTTNEAKVRCRLYSMDDFSLVCRYIGSTNTSMLQIGARVSEDGRHIICGSDDKRVYLWRLKNDLVKTIFGGQGKKAQCETYECIHASLTGPITVAGFAPDHVARLYNRGKYSKGGGMLKDHGTSEASVGGDDDRVHTEFSSVAGEDAHSASSVPQGSLLAGADDDVGLSGALILSAGMDGIVGVFHVS